MAEDATQQGAELSVSERIEQKLADNEPTAQEDTEQATEEVTEEATEEIIQDEATNDAESTADEDESAEQETEEANDEEVVSYELSHIAELLGVDESNLDVDKDGKVIAKTKVDGEEGSAKLNDLIKSHQLEGHLNKQNMEVIEAKKQLDAERQNFNQNAIAKTQQLEDSLTLAQNQLNHEFQSIDWNALEQTDSSQYTLMRQKFNDRQAQIQQGVQTLHEQRQAQQSEQLAYFGERLQGEKQQMLNAIPEWQTQEGFEKGRSDLRNGLNKSYGFSTDELDGVFVRGESFSGIDHRLILMARDALAYRKLQEGKPAMQKKVKSAPKVAKAGIKPRQANKVVTLNKTKAAIKKSGGKQGVADYLMQKGIV